jgi:NADP-dependent aldehyde dehydrogenase
MILTGDMLIGAKQVRGSSAGFRGVDPASGSELDPVYASATAADVDHACSLAWSAFDVYRETKPQQRAALLQRIATNILELGDDLIIRAMQETGLPRARLEGERQRTVGQLHLFAEVIRDGFYLDARIDPAMPDRKPLPRSDLRLRNIAIGPVAVFGASNFPLAFSVAGGDTASALAAGCPVVVKAHPAHPGTSEFVGRAVQAAVKAEGLPEGVFALLFGAGHELGAMLVADARIKAVGFTGSRRGGMALVDIASQRPEPIPVYAEMSSINPVILLPGALAARGGQIARGFVASLTMGAGQFCTNPGLVLVQESEGIDLFIAAASAALDDAPAATMLSPEISLAYKRGIARMLNTGKVRVVARGEVASASCGSPVLFETDAAAFLADPALRDEIFGAASLLVRCQGQADILSVLEQLEGQLTITLQFDEADIDAARALLPVIERRAGRIVVNGWPTGVEVAHAMVHGGPFPATSDWRTTSVGTLAIRRFLRPVCYQDLPPDLLPVALRDDNPLRIPRLVDGKLASA